MLYSTFVHPLKLAELVQRPALNHIRCISAIWKKFALTWAEGGRGLEGGHPKDRKHIFGQRVWVGMVGLAAAAKAISNSSSWALKSYTCYLDLAQIQVVLWGDWGITQSKDSISLLKVVIQPPPNLSRKQHRPLSSPVPVQVRTGLPFMLLKFCELFYDELYSVCHIYGHLNDSNSWLRKLLSKWINT